MPVAAVLGVGAVVLLVPAVATVYQFKVPPALAVAVKAIALAFWQYVTGLVTVGAAVATTELVFARYTFPLLGTTSNII